MCPRWLSRAWLRGHSLGSGPGRCDCAQRAALSPWQVSPVQSSPVWLFMCLGEFQSPCASLFRLSLALWCPQGRRVLTGSCLQQNQPDRAPPQTQHQLLSQEPKPPSPRRSARLGRRLTFNTAHIEKHNCQPLCWFRAFATRSTAQVWGGELHRRRRGIFFT